MMTTVTIKTQSLVYFLAGVNFFSHKADRIELVSTVIGKEVEYEDTFDSDLYPLFETVLKASPHREQLTTLTEEVRGLKVESRKHGSTLGEHIKNLKDVLIGKFEGLPEFIEVNLGAD